MISGRKKPALPAFSCGFGPKKDRGTSSFCTAAAGRLYTSSRTTRNGIFGAPFFARSLTLVPCSLLRNRTETSACYADYDGKRRVPQIKPSVPLLCRSIYDFRLITIPNISLFFWSKGVLWPSILVNLPSDRKLVYADGEAVFASVRPVLKCVDKALHGLTNISKCLF